MRSFVSLLLVSLIPALALLAADTPVVTSVVRPAHSENAETSLPPDVLTNEGIVQLSNAGFSDSFIVQKILLSRTRLDTTVEGLTLLRQNSVSERLIEYILQHEAQPMPSAASAAAQATPPALIRMKMVKTKLLVPTNEPARSGIFHGACYYALYPTANGSAWPFLHRGRVRFARPSFIAVAGIPRRRRGRPHACAHTILLARDLLSVSNHSTPNPPEMFGKFTH